MFWFTGFIVTDRRKNPLKILQAVAESFEIDLTIVTTSHGIYSEKITFITKSKNEHSLNDFTKAVRTLISY